MQPTPYTIQIEVPYRGPGNTIRNKPVCFDITKEGQHYIAAPQLSAKEQTLAGLPDSLTFTYQDGKAISLRGIKDGNLHVIHAIADALQKKGLLTAWAVKDRIILSHPPFWTGPET